MGDAHSLRRGNFRILLSFGKSHKGLAVCRIFSNEFDNKSTV